MHVSSIRCSVLVTITILSSFLLLSVVSGAQELGTAVLNGDVTDPTRRGRDWRSRNFAKPGHGRSAYQRDQPRRALRV